MRLPSVATVVAIPGRSHAIVWQYAAYVRAAHLCDLSLADVI
jgi:hypothetical protein